MKSQTYSLFSKKVKSFLSMFSLSVLIFTTLANFIFVMPVAFAADGPAATVMLNTTDSNHQQVIMIFDNDVPVEQRAGSTTGTSYKLVDSNGDDVANGTGTAAVFINDFDEILITFGNLPGGIITGYEDGTFGPNNNLTRAEVAKIISLIMEKFLTEEEAVVEEAVVEEAVVVEAVVEE